MTHSDVKKTEFVTAFATVATFLAARLYDDWGNPPILPSSTSATPADPSDPLLNRKEAARFLRVSVSTLRRFVEAGDLTPVMLTGKAPKYRRLDLERFINKR